MGIRRQGKGGISYTTPMWAGQNGQFQQARIMQACVRGARINIRNHFPCGQNKTGVFSKDVIHEHTREKEGVLYTTPLVQGKTGTLINHVIYGRGEGGTFRSHAHYDHVI